MKIFSPQESSTPTKTSGSPKTRKKEVREKEAISEAEIREKLAANVETSNTAKSKVLSQNSKQLGSGFLNGDKAPEPKILPTPEEEKNSVKEAHLLMSDVKLNDPKDPGTQEKLKSVISKGAFNFNPKEREALDKILNGV